jgi:hypothetical protein
MSREEEELRDRFAGMAMREIVSALYSQEGEDVWTMTPARLAESSYEIARAMMEQRSRR